MPGSGAGSPGPLGLANAEDGPEGGRILVSPSTTPTSPAPHQLLYETHKFGRLKRLGEKRVDADIEPGLDLVGGTGTDDGKGKIPGTRIRTQPSRSPQPIQPRHDHIQRHDVGPHLMNDIQTLGTIGRGHDLKPLQLEIDPDQLPDDLVVVHNEDPA